MSITHALRRPGHHYLPRAAGATIALLVLTGCGASASTDDDQDQADPTPSQHEHSAIEVTVADGEVSPPATEHAFELGDEVTLTITSDEADELHLHGYDEELALPAGEAATLTFTADIPGVFEAELHESGLLLFELKVE